MAPKADLYSVRVFGCSGNTNVVTEAIDWAVAHGMNVISMSLGSNYGNVANGGGALAEGTAVANAVAAGIIVVAASGNAGPTPYITSAPAVYPGAISVAATDALAGIPIATLTLSSGPTITVQNSNNATFANGSNWPIVVLRNANGTVSLGCNPSEYDKTQNGGIDITGKIVVTVRGTCSRVFRAGAAQHFGAAAAAMIDTSASSFPPYEGPIPGGAPDPNTGNIYEPVTIPFFGVVATDTTALTGGTSGASPPAPASAIANNAGLLAESGLRTGCQLLVGGAAHRRQRAAARGDRAGRVDGVGCGGHGQRLLDPLRHVDGDAAHRRRRGAGEAGASDLVGRRLAGRDRPDGVARR